MNARDRLIQALKNEIDNADFSEEKQDDSYQNIITKITEIFRTYPDNSLTLHDVVEVVNILDDLELPLKDAYVHAIISLILG